MGAIALIPDREINYKILFSLISPSPSRPLSFLIPFVRFGGKKPLGCIF